MNSQSMETLRQLFSMGAPLWADYETAELLDNALCIVGRLNQNGFDWESRIIDARKFESQIRGTRINWVVWLRTPTSEQDVAIRSALLSSGSASVLISRKL